MRLAVVDMAGLGNDNFTTSSYRLDYDAIVSNLPSNGEKSPKSQVTKSTGRALSGVPTSLGLGQGRCRDMVCLSSSGAPRMN